MRSKRHVLSRVLLSTCAVLTFAVICAPQVICPLSSRRAEGFLPPTWSLAAADGQSYPLGTDYLGRSFLAVLCHGFSGTARIALLGTAAVLAGCLALGVVHGSTRSRALAGLIGSASLGVMAVPEAAVIVTMATTWPRTAPPLLVNAAIVAVLAAFAVPVGARLIAERVRAVGRSGFVAASRSCGATPSYLFIHDIWPHLREDLAWIAASVLPRFVAVEVGLAYLGVEYRDFEGLGRALTKSFNNLSVPTALLQMLVTIAAILWIALMPQLILRAPRPLDSRHA